MGWDRQVYRRIKNRFVGSGVPGRAEWAGRSGYDRDYTPLPRSAVRFFRGFFIPDEKVGWTPWAVREALRIHAAQPFDLIVSTGPPFSAHGIGWRLARRLGLPWVAILMDPVVNNDAFVPLTPLHSLLMRRYERKIVTRSRGVVIATERMRQELIARNPDAAERVITSTNGFDPADFSDPEPEPHQGFVISFVGLFPPSRRPDAFIDAVARLIAEDDSFAKDVRVRFVGARDPQTEVAVPARNLDAVVERTGLVAHAEAVREMRRSTILLLVLGSGGGATLTSKLPEYLAAGKPILALVPDDGIAAETVRRARAGEVVDPEDADAVAGALARMYEMWKASALPAPDPDVVAEFKWDTQLGKVDRLLRDLAGP